MCHILYTDKQLSDVKRFCGSDAPDDIRSVLCVDRTFNVSSLFLTMTVFKNIVHRLIMVVAPWWGGGMTTMIDLCYKYLENIICLSA